MNALNEVYDFITGGSAITPFGVALAIAAAIWLPQFRAEAFVVLVAATFIAASFEKPS